MHLKGLLTDKQEQRGVRKKRLFKKAHYTQSIYADLGQSKEGILAEGMFSPSGLPEKKPAFNFTKQKKGKNKMQIVGRKSKKLFFINILFYYFSFI